MLNYLKLEDERWFLYLNGKYNGFFDVIMYWVSDPYFWLPLYIILSIWLIRRFPISSLLYFYCIILLEILSDQLSSHLIKDWVRRPRPSHTESLMDRIHLSKAGPGGEYGFVSGHACNSFALAIFMMLTLPPKYRRLKQGMIAWALLVSYSRIYNGVHYPGDVICGALLGSVLAVLISWMFWRAYFPYLLVIKRYLKRRMGGQ